MSRPCVCQGSNENCRYCFGRGFVSDNEGLPGKTEPSQFGARASYGRRRPLVQCPQCGVQVTRLQKHLRKRHGIQSTGGSSEPFIGNVIDHSTPAEKTKGIASSLFTNLKSRFIRSFSLPRDASSQASAKRLIPPREPPSKQSHAVPQVQFEIGPTRLATCPRCGATFPNKNLFDAHWKSRQCNTKPLLLKQPRIPRMSSTDKILQRKSETSGELVTCPQCNARVKSKKIAKHMRAKCPKRMARSSGSDRRRTQRGSASPNNAFSRLETGQPSSVKKRALHDQVHGRDRGDATRGYAHSYREQGRFGSHSSHDGFDDESSP